MKVEVIVGRGDDEIHLATDFIPTEKALRATFNNLREVIRTELAIRGEMSCPSPLHDDEDIFLPGTHTCSICREEVSID